MLQRENFACKINSEKSFRSVVRLFLDHPSYVASVAKKKKTLCNCYLKVFYISLCVQAMAVCGRKNHIWKRLFLFHFMEVNHSIACFLQISFSLPVCIHLLNKFYESFIYL